MLRNLLLGIGLLGLLACGTTEKVVQHTAKGKTLDEAEKIAFERAYIDGSKEKMLGNYNKALSHYQQALKIDDSRPAAYYEMANVLDALGQREQSFQFMSKAANMAPDNYWYNLAYATLLEERGEVKEAIKVLERLIANDKDRLELNYELAKLHFYAGDYQKSIDALNKIEQEVGVSEDLSLQKHRNYLKLNDVDKAANEVNQLIKAFPDESRYYSILAETYLNNDREDEAMDVYQRMLEKNQADPYANLALADYYAKKGEHEKSFEALKKAFASDGLGIDNKVQYVIRNYAVDSKIKVEKLEALELCELIIEAHPKDAKSYAIYADYLYYDNQKKRALDAYQKTINYDSSRFAVWSQLLVVQSELSDFEGMKTYAERATALFPSQPSVYFFHGVGLAQTGEYKDAIEQLTLGKDLVIDNPPLLGQFYSNIGDAYHELDNHPESDKAYEKALELQPDNVFVLNNYSYYLALRGEKLERAREMSAKSNQLSPGQASFQDTYAWVLYKLGEYESALEWINKAVDTNGSPNGELLEHKGDILFRLGKEKEALKYWKEAQSAGGTSEEIAKKIAEQKLND